ncbi:hypothetical protein, partial [Legionella sp. W05-934-2]|uniref:hypothetical protein n=1 Tax=Legionella sp. W05-934-2 TaxID=1198649 RepID=UPI00346347C3
MPAQAQIINKVNRIFRHNRRDFEFNRGGVCSGLSALYTKYALQNREDKFFLLLNQVNTLPDDYQLGTTSEIDRFLLDVKIAFNPSRYTGGEIQQSDVEKYININNVPPHNEFNFGLICSSSKWEKIFEQIKRDKRDIHVRSHNHVVNVSFKNGNYVVYDSNYKVDTKKFANEKDLVKELTQCFGIDEKEMGLSLRVFSNPMYPKCTDYPTIESLHKILEESPAEPLYKTIVVDNMPTHSLVYANKSRDRVTTNRLMNHLDLDADYIASELRSPFFLEQVLSLSDTKRKQLLLEKGIQVNLGAGNAPLLNQYLSEYLKRFPKLDAKSLAPLLISSLQYLKTPSNFEFHGVGDYSAILDLMRKILSEKELAENKTVILNLSLLTILHQIALCETPTVPFTLSTPAELAQQIQHAAANNQHQLLQSLLKLKDTLSDSDDIFTETVAKHIDAESMRLLLEANIKTNPKILAHLFQRNDKYIFEQYVNTVLKESSQPLVTDNLFEKIGNVRRIDILIAMRQNQLIKQRWGNPINNPTAQDLQDALFTAIITGNQDIVTFIKQQFQNKKFLIDKAALFFLVDEAFKNERYEQLEALASLDISLYHYAETKTNTISNRFSNIYHLYLDTGKLNYLMHGINVLSDEDRHVVFRNLLFKNNQEIIDALVKDYTVELTQYINLQLETALTKNDTNATKPLNAAANKLPIDVLKSWLSQKDTDTQHQLIKQLFDSKQNLLGAKLLEAYKALHSNPAPWMNNRRAIWQSAIDGKNEYGAYALMQKFPGDYGDEKDYQPLLDHDMLKGLAAIIKNKTAFVSFSKPFLQSMMAKALEKKHGELISNLINQYAVDQLYAGSATELCQQLISTKQPSLLKELSNENFLGAIDFNTLYQHCCQTGNIEALEWVLTHDVTLANEIKRQGLEVLFKGKNYNQVMDWVYQTGNSHLYQLIIKLKYPHPKQSLLNSIEKPILDPKLQKTNLYLNMLERALKDNNESKFAEIIGGDKGKQKVSESVVDFLVENLHQPRLLELLAKKYDLNELCQLAFRQKQYGAVGFLLEHFGESDWPISPTTEEKNRIVIDYLSAKESQSKDKDVRESLFALLIKSSPKNQFANMMQRFNQKVFTTIVHIEEGMIKNKRDLGGKIYRYSLSLKDFKNAIALIHEEMDNLRNIISKKGIDLKKPLQDENAFDSIIHIKKLMAANDITSDHYLEKNDVLLLEQITTNPRLETIVDIEQRLYAFTHHFGIKKDANDPLDGWPNDDKRRFFELMAELDSAMSWNKLKDDFLIPDLQFAMEHYRSIFNADSLLSTKESQTDLGRKDETTDHLEEEQQHKQQEEQQHKQQEEQQHKQQEEQQHKQQEEQQRKQQEEQQRKQQEEQQRKQQEE